MKAEAERSVGAQFRIRVVTVEDLDAVMQINLRCLPENYSRQFFLQHYNSHPNAFLVAENDGTVNGYAMCRVEYGLSNVRYSLARKGHIISVAVLPHVRRKGIASALVARALKALKDYGASEAYLEVRTSNAEAVELYRRMGFITAKTLHSYYLDGADAYLMTRRL